MMGHSQMQVEPVIQELHIPAGLAGTVELTMDVRCFLVPHAEGLLLIDTGLNGKADAIGAALDRVGAAWSDITDVVLTHWHPDHVGGLGEVVERSPSAAVWAGAADVSQIPSAVPLRPLVEGDRVRDIQIVPTPGHTAGHIGLLHDDGMLFVGDAVCLSIESRSAARKVHDGPLADKGRTGHPGAPHPRRAGRAG